MIKNFIISMSINTYRNLAVNACLTPVCAVHGAAVITVEGIGSVSKGLHPVQVGLLFHSRQFFF